MATRREDEERPGETPVRISARNMASHLLAEREFDPALNAQARQTYGAVQKQREAMDARGIAADDARARAMARAAMIARSAPDLGPGPRVGMEPQADPDGVLKTAVPRPVQSGQAMKMAIGEMGQIAANAVRNPLGPHVGVMTELFGKSLQSAGRGLEQVWPDDNTDQFGALDAVKQALERPLELMPFTGSVRSVERMVGDMLAMRRVQQGKEPDLATRFMAGGRGWGVDWQNLDRDRLEAVKERLDRDQQDRTVMGRAAEIGIGSAPFIAEFIASGSMVPALRVGQTKALERVMQRAAEQGLRRTMATAVTRAAPTLAKRAAVRTAVFPQHVAKNYFERLMPKDFELNERGLTITQAGQGPLSSLAMALGDTYIEFLSEETGGALLRPLGGAVLRKIPGARDAVGAMGAKIEDMWKALRPGRTTKSFVETILRPGGWDGVIEEMGEERVGDLLRAMIGVSNPGAADGWNPMDPVELAHAVFPGVDQLLSEAIAFSIPGAGARAAEAALYPARQQAEKRRAEFASYQAETRMEYERARQNMLDGAKMLNAGGMQNVRGEDLEQVAELGAAINAERWQDAVRVMNEIRERNGVLPMEPPQVPASGIPWAFDEAEMAAIGLEAVPEQVPESSLGPSGFGPSQVSDGPSIVQDVQNAVQEASAPEVQRQADAVTPEPEQAVQQPQEERVRLVEREPVSTTLPAPLSQQKVRDLRAQSTWWGNRGAKIREAMGRGQIRVNELKALAQRQQQIDRMTPQEAAYLQGNEWERWTQDRRDPGDPKGAYELTLALIERGALTTRMAGKLARRAEWAPNDRNLPPAARVLEARARGEELDPEQARQGYMADRRAAGEARRYGDAIRALGEQHGTRPSAVDVMPGEVPSDVPTLQEFQQQQPPTEEVPDAATQPEGTPEPGAEGEVPVRTPPPAQPGRPEAPAARPTGGQADLDLTQTTTTPQPQQEPAREEEVQQPQEPADRQEEAPDVEAEQQQQQPEAVEPPAAAPPATPRDDLGDPGPTRVRRSRLADSVVKRLESTEKITHRELYQMADEAFGGDQASGTYMAAQAHEVVEVALNRRVANVLRKPPIPALTDLKSGYAAREAIRVIDGLLSRIPAQRSRDADQQDLQQFSTPPTYSVLATHFAQLQPGDVVLEPSAGTGNLATVAASQKGVQVYVNEIDAARREALEDSGLYAGVFGVNAQYLAAMRADSAEAISRMPAPSVVIMNPPFSRDLIRRGKRDTTVGATHIEEALKVLQPGGRLVAIVGRGMSMTAPSWRQWWEKVGRANTVVANIPIDGSVYTKMGTSFGTRLLVIDKAPPPPGHQPFAPPVPEGADARNGGMQLVEVFEELKQEMLDYRRNPPEGGQDEAPPEGPAGPQSPDQPASPGGSGEGAAAPDRTGEPAGAGADAVGAAEQPVSGRGPAGTGARDGVSGPGRGPGGAARADEDAGAEQGARPADGTGTRQGPRGAGRAPASDRVEREAGEGGTGGRPLGEPGSESPVVEIQQETEPAVRTEPSQVDVPAPKPGSYLPVPAERIQPEESDSKRVAGLKKRLAEPQAVDRETNNKADQQVWAPFKASIRVPGAKPHPSDLVESVALASHPPPRITYTPMLPEARVRAGQPSLEQIEAIATGLQAMEVKIDLDPAASDAAWNNATQYIGRRGDEVKRVLEGDRFPHPTHQHRQGYLNADGTGVGKGTIVAGMLWDLTQRGHRRHIVIVPNEDLRQKTALELKRIGFDKASIMLWGKGGVSQRDGQDVKVKDRDGVIIVGYGALKGPEVRGLIEWAGGLDNNGAIIFDEAHKMSNATVEDDASERRMFRKKPSNTGQAGLALQTLMPNARVAYFSATAATELTDTGYMVRLPVYGGESSFDTMSDFQAEMGRSGLGAVEQVIGELRERGLFTSRTLTFDGVETSRLEVELDAEQEAIYDTAASLWRKMQTSIRQAFEQAMDTTKPRGPEWMRFKQQFQSQKVAWFKSLMSGMSAERAIQHARERLDAGEVAIFQVEETGQAAINAILATARENDADIGSTNFGLMGSLVNLVERYFPVNLYVTEVDDAGNERKVMTDRIDPDLVAQRDALLQTLAQYQMPDRAIQQVIDAFGWDNIALATSDGERVAMNPKTGLREVIDYKKPMRQRMLKEWEEGKRKVLIFSRAGGTGVDFHAAPHIKNQARRNHYLVDPSWDAKQNIQGLGRAHRTGETSQPHLWLVSTNIPSHMRVISTTARRLEQAGALNAGQREAAGAGLISQNDNVETKYGLSAVRTLFDQNQISEEDLNDMWLRGPPPKVSDWLNGMLTLPISRQRDLYAMWVAEMDRQIAYAKGTGQYDEGMADVRALSIREVGRQVIHETPSGQKAIGIRFSTVTEVLRRSWDDMQADLDKLRAARGGGYKVLAYVKRPRGHIVYAVTDMTYAMGGRAGGRHFSISHTDTAWLKPEDLQRMDRLSEAEAKAAWDEGLKKIDAFREHRVNIVTGALIPVWTRLHGQANLVRVTTDDGKTVVGRQMSDAQYEASLRALGVGVDMESRSAPVVLDAIEQQGAVAILDNGWRLLRTTVDRKPMLELSSDTRLSQEQLGVLRDAGAQTPVINYRQKIVVPFEKAEEFWNKALVRRSITDVSMPDDAALAVAMPRTAAPRPPGPPERERPHMLPETEEDIRLARREPQTSTANNIQVPIAPVQVSPIPPAPGEKPKKRNKILVDLSEAVGVKARWGGVRRKNMPRGTIGAYWPGNGAVRVQWQNDLPTFAHEIAHRLDDLFGIVAAWNNATQASPFDAELRQFWSVSPYVPQNPRVAYTAYQLRAEGVAEFVRSWLINPTLTESMAPQFAAHFRQMVAPQVLERLRTAGDAIRTLAGAGGLDAIGSGVQMNWDRPDATFAGRLAKHLRSYRRRQDGEDQFRATAYDVWSARFIDKLSLVKAAYSWAAERRNIDLKALDPAEDFRILSRLLLGSGAKLERVLQYGVPNGNTGELPGRGIDYLLAPLTPGNVKREMEVVTNYMIARRYIELREKERRAWEKQAAAARAAGEDPPPFNPTEWANLGSGLQANEDVARAAIAQVNAMPVNDRQRIEEAARRYRSWALDLLRYAVAKGRYSQEYFDKLTAADTDQWGAVFAPVAYVSFGRVMEAGPADRGAGALIGQGSQDVTRALTATAQPLRRLTGSARDIGDPYENLMLMTSGIIRETDRNETMRALVDMFAPTARRIGQGPAPRGIAEIAQQVGRGGTPNTVTIYRLGKEEHWQFDPDVYESLHRFGRLSWDNPIINAIAKITRFRRFTITHNPAFATRNWIRDTIDRSIKSRSGLTESIKQTVTLRADKMDEVMLDVYGGGFAGHFFSGPTPYYAAMRKAIRKRDGGLDAVTIWTGFGDGFTKAFERSERWNRIREYRAAYNAAKAEGLTEYSARIRGSYEARDMMDFALAGYWMEEINRIFMFSNAAVRGVHRHLQALGLAASDRSFTPEQRRAAFASGMTKITLFTIIPQIVARGLLEMFGDDDDRKAYREQPAYLRDLFWLIPNPLPVGPAWFRIPKGYETALYSAAGDRMYDAVVLGDEQAWEGFAGVALRAAMPFDFASFFGTLSPIYTALSNHDPWRDRDVIPVWQRGTYLQDRDVSRAAAWAQGLQDVLSNLPIPGADSADLFDARMLEWQLKEWTGGLGALVSGTAELVQNQTAQQAGEFVGSDVPGLGARAPTWAARDVQWLLDQATKVGRNFGTGDTEKLGKLLDASSNPANQSPEAQQRISSQVIDEAAKVRERWMSAIEIRRDYERLAARHGPDWRQYEAPLIARLTAAKVQKPLTTRAGWMESRNARRAMASWYRNNGMEVPDDLKE